ncbi:putative cytochrome P450 [Xylaria acuta]|nr:putative cytochrome P450 [Xylaria acuta]
MGNGVVSSSLNLEVVVRFRDLCTMGTLFKTFAGLSIVYVASHIVYDLCLHPLRKYPGPLLGRSTLLSFASIESWKDIYGYPSGARETCVKSEFYEGFGGGFNSSCIGSERNPKEHGRMRKALNMMGWFEMIAFDIIGEMSFGESFGSVAQGRPHFWSQIITGHLFAMTVVDTLRRYRFLVTLGKLLLPLTTSLRKKHTQLSRDKVARRLKSTSSRADFVSLLINKVKAGEMDMEGLTAHDSTLTVAGGETVAIFLASATYYLLNTPGILARLQTEIRTAFESYSEINATRAQQLPYLQAVVAEVSPGTQISGHYVPACVEVYTSSWSMTHDEKYFHDPFTFKPKRWIDPKCKDIKEASQPFSLGPRGCIGKNFAYLEINLILARILWTYDMELMNKDLD